jgi:hypothetical protein
MDAACRDIEIILELTRHGGTLIPRDKNTAILVDYDLLTFHAMEALSTLHPDVHISTQACEDSSSGFMVVFVYKQNPGVLCSANIVLCVCTCVCLLLSVMLVAVYTTSHSSHSSRA